MCRAISYITHVGLTQELNSCLWTEVEPLPSLLCADPLHSAASSDVELCVAYWGPCSVSLNACNADVCFLTKMFEITEQSM